MSRTEAAALHNCHECSGLGSSHNPGLVRKGSNGTGYSVLVVVGHSSRPLEGALDIVNVTLGLLGWL